MDGSDHAVDKRVPVPAGGPRGGRRPRSALEARVLGAAAAAGVDVETGADINVLMQPSNPDRDPRLHAAVDLYVPLHPACVGHVRLAAGAGNSVLELGDGALARAIAESTATKRAA